MTRTPPPSPPPRRPRPRRTRRGGLTLIELLLGLAITTIIGAAIVSILFAVTRGAADDDDLRALIARARRMQGEASAALRRGERVLDADEQRLILWCEDRDDDGRVDVQELLVIDYDPVDGEVNAYQPIDTAFGSYLPSHNFASVVSHLLFLGQLVPETWARGVVDCVFTLDRSDPADARLASFRLTLREGRFDHEAIAAASLPQP